MRTFFLVVLEVILFLVFVGYGEFPGFVAWLVLSFGVYFANRHFALKTAEVLIKAEREQRRRVPASEPAPRQLPARKSAPKRKGWVVQIDGDQHAMTLDEMNTAYQDGTIDEDTFVRRDGSTVWRALREEIGEDDAANSEPAPVPPKAQTERRFVNCSECDAKNKAIRETCWQCKNPLQPSSYQAVDSSELIEGKRASNLRKMASKVGPVCSYCGSLNEGDAERCDNCGRDL